MLSARGHSRALPTVDGVDLDWSDKIVGFKGKKVSVLEAFIFAMSEIRGQPFGFHHLANPDKPNFVERILKRVDFVHRFEYLQDIHIRMDGKAIPEYLEHRIEFRINPDVAA